MRHLLVAALLVGCGSPSSPQGGDDSAPPAGDDSVPVTDVDGDGIKAPDDCNDEDDSIHPGAAEVVADGIDQDCDQNDLCYVDADLDGYGSSKTLAAPSCEAKGVSATGDDCADADAALSPGGQEAVADGIDQNCDGGDDCYIDVDGDGFGSVSVSRSEDLDCADPGEAGAADDCLDSGTDAELTFPGAASSDSAKDCMTDADDDGYGSQTPAKGVVPGSDCDDTDAAASCVTIHVGNDTEFSGTSSHSPDYLLGSRLEVKATMTVTDLALIAKASGPNVRMALYTDAKGPDALLAETDSTPMVVGVLEIPVTPVTIDVGYYWIMAIYDTNASVGIGFPSSGGVYKYQYMSFSDALPDPFGAASSSSGQVYNYYIVGH